MLVELDGANISGSFLSFKPTVVLILSNPTLYLSCITNSQRYPLNLGPRSVNCCLLTVVSLSKRLADLCIREKEGNWENSTHCKKEKRQYLISYC